MSNNNYLELGSLKWQVPMLATLTKHYFSDPAWIYEPKHDGERCVVYCNAEGVISAFSRYRKLNDIYPEVITALQPSSPKAFIVDGEMASFNADVNTHFAALQDRINLMNPTPQQINNNPVCYFIFDILYYDGQYLHNIPLIERKSILKNSIVFNDTVRYVEHIEEQGLEFYQQAYQKGQEGIMAKKADSLYISGPSLYWQKFKCAKRQEFVIVGFSALHGFPDSLLLGYYENNELCYAGEVKRGLKVINEKQFKEQFMSLSQDACPLIEEIVTDNVKWVRPSLIAEIEFTDWENQEIKSGSYLGLRYDKLPQDVKREKMR